MALGSFFYAQYEEVDVLAIPKTQSWNMTLRVFYGVITLLCQLWSIQLLPLSLSIVIFWTQPISVIVVARIFNGETLNTL
jgi:drug/metabolite transporter (DMT)-like permease